MKFELRPNNRGVSDETLLEGLRQIARLLGTQFVPREHYDGRGRFHPKTLVKRFGSWNGALERAGLQIRKPNNLSKDECLSDLRRVAAPLNQTALTVQEYRDLGRFTEGPFRRLFGSWANALQEAGLAPSNGYHKRYSEEELHRNLEIVWRRVGRQPKRSDMRKPLSPIGADSYSRRFGSWRNALEAFVAYANDGTNPERGASPDVGIVSSQSTLVLERSTQRTSRSVSWRLRFLVMRRDGFKCRLCGTSPALALGVVLVVDHVVPWSKGGETILNNLQTLCEICNGGKSDHAIEA